MSLFVCIVALMDWFASWATMNPNTSRARTRTSRADQPDRTKFFRDEVSHMRRQLGYITSTCTMRVTIPEDKRQALTDELINKWGPSLGCRSFTLSEAAELLGVLVSLCRVCPWGFFCSKIYITQCLRSFAAMHPEFGTDHSSWH
jgi:hypothetical protein